MAYYSSGIFYEPGCEYDESIENIPADDITSVSPSGGNFFVSDIIPKRNGYLFDYWICQTDGLGEAATVLHPGDKIEINYFKQHEGTDNYSTDYLCILEAVWEPIKYTIE